MGADPEAPLANALAAYGVDPDLVKIEWDDLCQEDVLTFSRAQFSELTLARLAELYLTFPSRFVFPSDDLQNAFERRVLETPSMLRAKDEAQRERRETLARRGLSGFEPFNPLTENMTMFAARAEAACGFSRGEALSVRNDESILVAPVEPSKLQTEDLTVLLSLLEQSAPGVTTYIVGQEAG